MGREIVIRARDGDREAFARLAAASIARLDTVARLITRDPERARDAVQETLARAWRDLPGLRDPDRFDAWLRRVLVRACMDELRGMRARTIEVALIDVHHPAIPDATRDLAERDALERAFRRLDPEQRSLVVLYYYLDLPLAEAASAAGIPEGTAKSRLARARDALRAALEADARPGAGLPEGEPA
jgi:RNA polymerase sigma-70 factor (ECF subfamily)